MPESITRRTFIKGSTALGVTSILGANLLGLKGDEVRTAQLAHEHGLGEIDLARLRIEEVTL